MKPLFARQRTLLLAIALIIAAALVSFALIRQSQTTETYLVATHDLASGTRLQVTDLRQTQAALGTSASHYLHEFQSGLTLRGAVLAGQFIPATAITKLDPQTAKPVLVTPSQALSKNIRVGSRIQLWFVPKQNTEAGQAVQLLQQAEVLSIQQPEQAFGQSNSNVEVAVPQESLTAVITAIASAGFISVISED